MLFTGRIQSTGDTFLRFDGGVTVETYGDPTFVPQFLDELQATVTVDELAGITATCAGSQTCIFDTLVTST